MKRAALSIAYAADQSSPRHAHVMVRKGTAAPQRVRFESDSLPLRKSGDALLCLGLGPSMEVNAPLQIGTPPGKTLSEKASDISELLEGWYPGMAPLKWTSNGKDRPVEKGTGTALFFSGGVDSAYSITVGRARIDTLITLIGADVPVEDSARAARLAQVTRAVAKAEGMRHIVITTDIRKVSDPMIGWVEYHGAVLAAVAHMLGDYIGHVLIASSADEATFLRPWGTHPELDPLWASDTVHFEHHALAPRFTKVASIVQEPHLMAGLRVCDYDDSNCGACPDCVFMLNALAILDGFKLAPTYNRADFVDGRVIADGRGTRADLLDMRTAAMTAGQPVGLPEAIDLAIARFDRQERIRALLGVDTRRRKFKRWKRRLRYRRAAP